MSDEKIIPALVTGGKANAGPPLGPALAPMGLNVMAIVNDINEKTKEYPGMRVPVKIIVQVESKTFTIEVGIPTSSTLLAKDRTVGSHNVDSLNDKGSPASRRSAIATENGRLYCDPKTDVGSLSQNLSSIIFLVPMTLTDLI